MNTERVFVLMIVVDFVIGLAFVGLAVGHAVKVGAFEAVLRHPLLGSGTAALATAVLGSLFLQTLRPKR